MAAPASVDTKNLHGKWLMNRSLSDAIDPVLSLQGIGWLTRKAIGAATVTQHIRQSTKTGENGQTATEICIDQFLTGGLKGNNETFTLDWHYRGHSDWIFGNVQGRSRLSTLAKLLGESKGKGFVEEDANHLAEGWLKETEEGEIIEAFADNDGGKWTGWQVWGFADVGGERKLTRRFAVRRKDKDQVVRIRLVYDYLGALE
ncbi:hypothetical protein EJ02DRAFT_434642 [Clathrospora elynae]|uniref:Lccl domain-containing protein n=1 Tax=Clathrospora elynae TaxID=706981 RepID=A0A6A5SX64_9PLEO|nr:hypothetical protein EJ02DRAFT_434642 [Clathrospora elynae]